MHDDMTWAGISPGRPGRKPNVQSKTDAPPLNTRMTRTWIFWKIKELKSMAKNNYFEIAYKILAYLYECFQAGVEPELSKYSAEALGINAGYWRNVIGTR